MVFLTAALWRTPGKPDKFWKRQMVKRLTWNGQIHLFEKSLRHFYGRRRNCYKIAMPNLRHALKYATQDRKLKKIQMIHLFETRIAAACAEHGIQFSTFMSTLDQVNIALDRKVLADLCIFEPRTFQSLCELVRKRYMEIIDKNLHPSSRVFTKGML